MVETLATIAVIAVGVMFLGMLAYGTHLAGGGSASEPPKKKRENNPGE